MGEIYIFLTSYPLYWGVFITLAPTGILIFKWKELDRSFRLLMAYLTGKFAIDLMMIYYAGKAENNIWLHNLIVPLRYVLLSSMFSLFLDSLRLRKWIRISVPVFLVLAIADVYFSNISTGPVTGHLFVRYIGIVECLLMLLWILLYFYEVFNALKIANLLKSPRFLVAVAWLLYYASLVFFAPLFYYIYRIGGTLDLGLLEYIPDCMDFLAMIIITIAVSFISGKQYD